MDGWEEIEEIDDTGLAHRRRLIKHLEWVIRPPLADVIRVWELEELVEEAKGRVQAPRGP